MGIFTLIMWCPLSFEIWMRYRIWDLAKRNKTHRQKKEYFKNQSLWRKVIAVFRIEDISEQKQYYLVQLLRLLNFFFLIVIVLVLTQVIQTYKPLGIGLCCFYGFAFIWAMIYKRIRRRK